MHRKIACLILTLLFAASVSETFAVGTASLPATRLQTRYSGLAAPIYLTHAGDGTKRVFIVERGGIIKVVQPGSNTPTEFLNITALTSTSGERGLLSMAFHPQYESNRRFFLYFTRVTDGSIQVSEFETSATNPNVALTTEKPIINIPHPTNNNHNGGTLNFGADGYLYIATGDGGGQNDPTGNAQNINSLLGKMLRIDINTPTGYGIPPTNPFAGGTPGADEIYALGLRNPFRWSVDRGGTNQIWLADVGQNSWEEVNIINSGGNFGWRVYEATTCTGLDPGLCTPTNFVAPLFFYSSQNTTSRCSITGGYVYRGSQRVLPNGAYIYGDYCTGEILVWHQNQQIPLHDISDFNLVSFGEDEDGELYVIQAGAGIIQKLVSAEANADFDGDRRTDLAIFRPSNDTFYLLNANTGTINVRTLSLPDETLSVAEDYDGDGVTDLGVYRSLGGNWLWLNSSDSTVGGFGWGNPGDIPVPGDYDGDARSDFAVYRPSNNTWYIRGTANGFITSQWGANGDVPISGDFDGDGRRDLTVWRPSNGNWYVIFSSNGAIRINQYGLPNDIPATGDFDNDGRNDLALFRPSTGLWYQKLSSNNNFRTVSWGVQGDVPVVGDYDNDAIDDVAVWRPSTGTWYVVRSTGGILRVNGWGVASDFPVPNRDAP